MAVLQPSQVSPLPPGDVQLDYVGSVTNAGRVIAALHQGEKRLVFCDSRRLVEELGAALRARGVNTFLSHASLALDERRRSEQAFAESRNCVIVATSTLELGVDVGDLDRVIQINAPATVASFLQRIGRSGRRPGAERNCLFLALDQGGLLDAAGLLLLWSRGWVEPVVPPPEPRHIVAQQILALCLQEGQVGENLWQEWWAGLDAFGPSAGPIAAHLVREGYLDSDDGMLFIGPEAELRFGRRHFMELTTAFTAMPQFTVLQRPGGNRPHRPRPAHSKDRGATAPAAGWPQLAGHLDRLETPPLFCRAGRRGRQGPMGLPRIRGRILRAQPGHPGCPARNRSARQADPPGGHCSRPGPGHSPRFGSSRRNRHLTHAKW